MTSQEYFLYAMEKKLTHKLNWYYSSFCEHSPTDKSPYFTIQGKKYMLHVNDKLIPLDSYQVPDAPINFKDKIKIDKTIIANALTPIETTIGRALLNKLLIADPFGDKIEFQDHPTIEYLESQVEKGLKDGSITIPMYHKFTLACDFILQFADIFNIAATPKNILAPVGLDEFKKKKIEEYTKKYGENWMDDITILTLFEKEIVKYDMEWLGDDPSLGGLMGGKTLKVARKAMFLEIGKPQNFKSEFDKSKLITRSLSDGYPKDRDHLTDIYNAIVYGSFNRGSETRKGGALAKDISRYVSACKVVNEDCGSMITKPVIVTPDNAKFLIGRYMLTSKGVEAITESITKQIGRSINIRSPLYCKTKNSNFCKICVGDNLNKYENGISLSAIKLAGVLMYIPMKKMHGVAAEVYETNLTEMMT